MNVTYKVTGVSRQPVSIKERRRRSVLYVSIKNQDFAKPVKEMLTGFRWNNPFRDYREHVLPAAFKMLGLPEGTKARWSQKAGCGCGCSPGFIVDHYPPEHMWAEVDMTIEFQQELELKIETGKVS